MRLVTAVILMTMLSSSVVAEKYALLVGISDYQSKQVKDLDGPKYDVESLQSILPAWGIHTKNTTVLVDVMATKNNIINSLKDLESKTVAGDQVFIYLSGHGTSPFDDKVGLEMAHTTGAFLPYDSIFEDEATSEDILNSLIVGQRDIQPILKNMDKNRQVFVVIDACFSENTARSITNNGQKPQSRAQSLSFSMLSSAAKTATIQEEETDYPYENVVFFAASAKHEVAGDYHHDMDLPRLTLDGKPHGVFTDALLRVLTGAIPVDANGDKKLSYLETYKAASSFLSDAAQSPKISYKVGNQAIERSVFASENPELIQEITPAPFNNRTPLKVYVDKGLLQVKSILSETAGIDLVDKVYNAELQVKPYGSGMKIVNATGEVIKTYSVLRNSDIYSYFKAQHWLHSIRELNGAGGFSLSIDLSDGKNIGSTVRVGEEFDLTLTTDQPANLWLIAMDSDGHLSILYPMNSLENSQSESGENNMMKILAGNPLGEDWLVAFAFNKKIKSLDKFVGGSLHGASLRAEQLYSIIANNQSNMAKHEKRLITANAY